MRATPNIQTRVTAALSAVLFGVLLLLVAPPAHAAVINPVDELQVILDPGNITVIKRPGAEFTASGQSIVVTGLAGPISGVAVGALHFVELADLSVDFTATSVTIDLGSSVWRVDPIGTTFVRFDLSTGSTPGADTTRPVLVSLTRVGPSTIDVVAPPAAPTVRLEFSDNLSGLGSAEVRWQSPSGGQELVRVDTIERLQTVGVVFVQSPLLTIFHEPGTWLITFVRLCDRAGNCRSYSGAALDAITPAAGRTYEIVNTVAPDTVAPRLVSGVITTTVRSLGSEGTQVRINATVTDDVSGLVWAQACFRSPSGSQTMCASSRPGRPAKNSTETLQGTLRAGVAWETGTWTLESFVMRDVPGNERSHTAEATLDAKFPGGRTFVLNP